MGQKQFFPCQLLGLGLGVCTVKVVIEVAKVGDCLHFCLKKIHTLGPSFRNSAFQKGGPERISKVMI